LDTMTQQTKKLDVPHSRYDKTNKQVYSTQHDVAEAWVNGKYPGDDGGTAVVRNSSEHFKGIQRSDGSGVLRHYRTIEAVRTLNGLVISNKQCWARGFAHCTKPSGVNHRLPLSTIEAQLEDGDKLRHINSVVEEGSDKVVYLKDRDYGFYVGRDPSIRDTDDTMIIKLKGDELDLKPSEVCKELLTPEEVKESGLKVYHSDEYAKTRFVDPDEEVIEREGLKEDKSRYGRSDVFKNHKMYREDLQGECVVRHGEWFFIPAPDFVPGEMEESSMLLDGEYNTELGSHEVRRKDSLWKVGEDLYLRGTVGHAHKDHKSVNLGDVWYKAVRHDRDVVIAPSEAGTRGRVD